MSRVGVKVLSAQERRRQIYDMRKSGNDWATIVEVSGLKESTCKAYLKASIAIDGLDDIESHVNSNALEKTKPGVALDVLAAGMEPFQEDRLAEMREACKKAGMHPKHIQGLIQRMKSRYAPVMEEGRRMTVDDMKSSLESKIRLTLGHLDEFAISQAGAKDLAYILGILVDRYQILSNKPTTIVDFTTRQQLSELVPAVVEEARRRGIALPELQMVERVDGPL